MKSQTNKDMMTNDETKEHRYEQIAKTLELVTKATAIICDLNEAEMKSESRERQLVDARRIAYAVAKKHFNYPYTYIGRFYGKNHATIIHQVKAHEAICQTEKDYCKRYEMVRNCVRDKIGIDHLKEYKALMDNIFNKALNSIAHAKD